jgi:hypothetical protein
MLPKWQWAHGMVFSVEEDPAHVWHMGWFGQEERREISFVQM